MLIRTEYRGQRYSMGSSDPLPVRFEIRFGGLNFHATGNGYLMRLTNREELRARRQVGFAPVAAARVATTPTPASTDAEGPSAPRRRRRSGQRSRQAQSERRHAARVASQRETTTGVTVATPVGERSISGPRFPIGLRGATAAYVTNTNANTTMRRVPPGRHVLVARDPSASAGDESSLGSVDALPPATSHGYAEWDFSGVPDPMMFRRFLDATDYWFGCSDDSSAGSYDPVRECCVVITNDPANAADAAGAGDGEVPPALGTGSRLAAGPSALPPHRRGGPTSTRSWPKRASWRPSWRKSTARCGCFAPPSRGKPLRAATARVNWAGTPAIASTPTSMSTIRTRPRKQAKSSSPPRHCCGPCPPLRRPRRETCTARRRHSSSKRPSSRRKVRRPESAPSRTTGFTPFFLVHGAEAVLPTDLKYGSPRIRGYDEDANQRAREDSLDQLDEARLVALMHSARYQQSLRRYQAQKVHRRDFSEGDLVLRLRQDNQGRHTLSPYRRDPTSW
jgi:hypothetical protein